MPDEYQSFFDRFDQIVYISFGTMFMPPDEQMRRIIDAIKITESKTIGYIVSIKDYAESYDFLKQTEGELQNLMVRTWVPQRQLLAHPKTQLFMTHCGANGAIEAMYYGVAMLGFPQMDEQLSVAYRLQKL